MERIDEYIRNAKSLPPAPRVLPELMQLLRKTDVDSSKVVDLVTFDPRTHRENPPGLQQRGLRRCNTGR